VVITHGGAAGGYAMYVQDGTVHWTDNLLGARITTVSAGEPLPPGPCTVDVVFTPTGRFQGDVVISYDGREVGAGHLPMTTPVTYGIVGFTVGYQRGTPVSPTYAVPFAISPDVLRSVVVEPEGREHRDAPAEARAADAMQ
jgi:arylsulfatase